MRRTPLHSLVSVWLLSVTGVAILACSMSVAYSADDKAKAPAKPGSEKSAKPTPAKSLTTGDPDETAAMEFASRHHPELAALLKQLRKSAPREYQSALLDLDRTRQRLERSQERMPERYELELAEWKVNSRIRLLAARLTMGQSADAGLEAELRERLRERLDIRAQLLQEEQERLTRRLEKLGEQLATYREQPAELVDRELATLLRNASAAEKSAVNKDSRPKRATDAVIAKPGKPQSTDKPATDKTATDKPATGAPARPKPIEKSVNKNRQSQPVKSKTDGKEAGDPSR